MSALLIGFLLVVVSAATFGFALFGRRPIPQPAIAGASLRRGLDSGAENRPSALGTATPSRTHEESNGTPVMDVHLSAADVRPTKARRLRAAGLLVLSVVGSAVLIGAVLSIVAVVAILLIS